MELFRNVPIRARIMGVMVLTLALPLIVYSASLAFDLPMNFKVSLFLSAFCLFLGGLMAAVLAYSLTRPIKRIRSRIATFIKKRQPITVDDPGSDEMSSLAGDLDQVFGLWKGELAKLAKAQQSSKDAIEESRAAATEVERQLHLTRSCLTIARKLNTTFDFQENLKTILDESVRALNVQWASIILVNRETLEMKVACVRGVEQSLLEDLAEDQYPAIKLKPSEGIAGQVIKEGLPIIANQGYKDKRFKVFSEFRTREERTASILCAPILGEDGKALGVMNFSNRINPPLFRNEDIPFAQDLCTLAALVIERNRVYRNLFRDDVTGLISHKVWRGQLDEEGTRAVRYAQPLTVMILDVDRFQQVVHNATPEFALEVGNQIGQVVQRQLRDMDLGSRAKDRFYLLLPHTDTAGGVFLAGRIKEAIESLSFTFKNMQFQFHLSAGIANFPDTTADAAKLLEQALAALEQAKVGGRNRAVIFGRNQSEGGAGGKSGAQI